MKSYTVFFMLLLFVALAAACSCNRRSCGCSSCGLCGLSASMVDCGVDFTTCICTTEFLPVCATNGCTYTNSCRMTCAGATLAYPGPCKTGCCSRCC